MGTCKDRKMYYYTSTDTMRKILSGGNMFATNLGYMNDSREYVNGLNAVGKVLETKVSKERKDTFLKESYNEELTYFSISFCKEDDLLSQWIAYARESGVSMEMTFEEGSNVKLDIVKNDDADKEPINIDVSPKDILYVDMKNGELKPGGIEEIWRWLNENNGKNNDDYLTRKGKDISAYIKQKDFDQEKEYRIAINSATLNDVPKINYRMDRHVLKPYLDVKCAGGWPVTSVMVGPGSNQGLVFQSIKYFLNHAKIQSSKLMTRAQWKSQIGSYFENGGERHEEIWDELKNGNDTLGFYKSWEELDHKPGKEMCQDEKETWAEKISKVIQDKEENKDKRSVHKLRKDYCFTASGIILKRSEIPYIY